MPLMQMNQRIHQESVTANLRQITSNPGPLLPKPVLGFQLSRVDLIINKLIMVMLRFTLQIFQFNLTLNILHNPTPIQSNHLMMMKCTISYNYFTHNMMVIFWILTSRCFRLEQWPPLLQNFIQPLLCCFINIEQRMVQSQIACHNFLCVFQPRPL